MPMVREVRSTSPGQLRLGPYDLTECIGRGGMAVVYKGKRRGVAGFEKQVVVKTILPQLAKNPSFIRLFKHEARLSALLLHNNVVRVHDFGIIGNTPFLELEYLSGWDLKQLFEAVSRRGGRLPVSITLRIITEVCRGLAYAHSFVDEAGVHRPIIHRDVSPANVMIGRDGAVKLLDFGLASLTRGEILPIDTFRGKLAYMSPEQIDHRQIDRRADVFALGALCHELLTGRRLFGAGNDAETVRRVRNLVIEPPSWLNPDVPPTLDVIVLRALLHDPDQRYFSAVRMLAGLEELGSLRASHRELMRFLGSVAPHVFSTACDGCGSRLPCGAVCTSCTTQPDAIPELDDAEVLEAPTEPVDLMLTQSPPPRLRRTPLVLQIWLLVCALWRAFSFIPRRLSGGVAAVGALGRGSAPTVQARNGVALEIAVGSGK
jgi:serine/threonine protein kinase